MNFKDKSGKTVNCKMSCIPVKLCEFPAKELALAAVYGFGAEPMLLLSNLTMQEKKRLCHIVTKVYLMRWRIEEYFKFKKQQFELEELKECSKRIYEVPKFIFYALGYAIERVLSMCRKGINGFLTKKVKSQQKKHEH